MATEPGSENVEREVRLGVMRGGPGSLFAEVKEMFRTATEPSPVRIVNAILMEALRQGASDIHIEPSDKHTRVRYRLDGLLQEQLRIPSAVHASITSRIKVLAKLDITERRKPQEGRISLRVPDRTVDLRVSTLPILYGENIVLRILDRGLTIRRVEDLGLDQTNLRKIRVVIQQPQGMILSTGPTGSGKTTTLYALLNEHVNPVSSYGTIEDPVEYHIEQASQVFVQERSGMTFPVALRSMLRQDPDVILVGEMRDLETVEIAFKAALTGHLVFSTLHTNSAIATVSRLITLGVERFLTASALTCAIGQRLVRLICPHCASQAIADPNVLALLGLTPNDVRGLKHGAGCAQCQNMGYFGRIGVFELLVMSDRLREVVLAAESREMELSELAREEGMTTMFEDALRKVREGQTTLQEILRVLGPRMVPGRPCPKCGFHLQVFFRICPSCGLVIKPTCRRCTAHLLEEWKYCPTCGEPAVVSAKETAPAAPAAARPAQARSPLPQAKVVPAQAPPAVKRPALTAITPKPPPPNPS
ncbi:MAG: ATPase, T2SS/T4P/T4SS family [Planctomycetota bacterium]